MELAAAAPLIQLIHELIMPLPLRRSLLLALCFAIPATAAPRKPVVKKAVAQKAPAPSSAEVRAVRELKRMVAAYKKVGSFTLTSRDTIKVGPFALSGHGEGSVAKDGRRSLRSEFTFNHNGALAIESIRLYDGQQFRESTNNRLLNSVVNTTRSAAQLKRTPKILEDFFVPSPGILVATAPQDEDFGLGKEPGKVFTFRDLGQGKSEITVRHLRKRPSGVQEVSTRMLIGSDGFLERVEGKETPRGSRQAGFYVNCYLSRPQPLDAKASLNWDNLMSPPPLIIGDQQDIPPVVPESGKMPPQ